MIKGIKRLLLQAMLKIKHSKNILDAFVFLGNIFHQIPILRNVWKRRNVLGIFSIQFTFQLNPNDLLPKAPFQIVYLCILDGTYFTGTNVQFMWLDIILQESHSAEDKNFRARIEVLKLSKTESTLDSTQDAFVISHTTCIVKKYK